VDLTGHLALSRLLGFQRTLDERTRLLVSQLAAERSGCRWCIERGRHEWRLAGLPLILLRHLTHPATSALLTERDRAALDFAEAVVSGGCAGEAPEAVLQRTQLVFSDGEIAELALCLADHHLLNDPDS
jgi:alkylhydroperoxidase family enzyme